MTAFAKIAECYEEMKQYSKAEEAYKRILKYTGVKAYRKATMKRLEVLRQVMALEKAKKIKKNPKPVTKSSDQGETK